MSDQEPQASVPPAEAPPPPRPNEPSKFRVAGAVALVTVLVFSAVGATIVFGNLGDRFASFGQPDRDGDGIPDAQDAFPDDPWEWADSDNDSFGDNSDPFPHDHDNDGFNDTEDFVPDYDASVCVLIDTVRLVDKPDLLDTNGEVSFRVMVDGGEPVIIGDNGSEYSFEVGTTYSLGKSVYLNVDDNVRYHAVTIAMLDADPGPSNETLDIDPVSDSNRTLDLVFDLATGDWSGDNSTGHVDGSDDGTQATNDRDAMLNYSLSIAVHQTTKTYRWNFDSHSFVVEVNVSTQAYLSYKIQTPDRAPAGDDARRAFVTSSDPVVVEIAWKLKQLAITRGYSDLKAVGLALGFVEDCISYRYDNVSTGQDEYWRYSVETLYEEVGDCEDTSILLASVLEAMNYDSVLLIYWEHMAVGVDCPGATGGHYDFEMKEYYYCETTGEKGDPSWSVGDIPPTLGSPQSILQVS